MPRYRITILSEDEYYLHEEEIMAVNSLDAWNEAHTTAEELWPDVLDHDISVERVPG